MTRSTLRALIRSTPAISPPVARRSFASVDAQLAVEIWAGLALSLRADNLLGARPGGWQSLVECRFRAGVEVGGGVS